MDVDKILEMANQFEKIAQEQRKPTPGGVLNIAKQTIKGIIEHPSVIPQAVDQVWNSIISHIEWSKLSTTQQNEFKRKLKIAKMKQAEDMKRVLQEMDYESGKELTLQNQKL